MFSASTVTLLLLLTTLVEIGEYCNEVEEWHKKSDLLCNLGAT